ncbi:cupin domain-containing protein, partial [Rhizobium hidalgonense]|uniref:cupin domain-containing protein n=1 Tax=Rhizobium hidalgonense TaxID=1538159 RepID=UPI001FE1754F
MNFEMPGDQFRRKTSRSIGSGALRHDGGSAPFHCREDFEIAPRTIVVLCLFRLASDLNLPSVAASTIFPPARAGGMVTVNGGGSFSLVGARFAVGGNHADMLLEMLPPVVHLSEEAERDALR